MGWPVQGIYGKEWDGTDINCLKRLELDIGDVIAVGNDFSKIRIYSYPVLQRSQEFWELQGHSSHITQLDFFKNSYLVSAGGEDQTIIIWKLTF